MRVTVGCDDNVIGEKKPSSMQDAVLQKEQQAMIDRLWRDGNSPILHYLIRGVATIQLPEHPYGARRTRTVGRKRKRNTRSLLGLYCRLWILFVL